MFAYTVVVVESLMTLWAFVDAIDRMRGGVHLTTTNTMYLKGVNTRVWARYTNWALHIEVCVSADSDYRI